MPGNALGRLRKGREFDLVYSEGTVIGGPLFVVRFRANASEANRWGFAVGKKMAPKAVDRNRVRRQLREAARHLDVATGYDLVVTARPSILNARFASIRTELERSLARASRNAP